MRIGIAQSRRRALPLVCALLLAHDGLAQAMAAAHRGASLLAPENTIAALALGAARAELVEFDVRVSLDGELVVMHDASVDRTTDGTGLVAAMTLGELKTLDAGSWYAPAFAGERIPTLAEAIDAILPAAVPLIERKEGSADRYVQVLQNLRAETDVVVQSFDWDFLQSVHALDPSITLAALGSGRLTAGVLADLQARGVGMVAWSKDSVTPETVGTVHSSGMSLLVWTVNGPAVQGYLDMGVDGVISDDPGLVADLANDLPSSNEEMAAGIVSYWKLDDGRADVHSVTAADVEARNPGRLEGFGVPPDWAAGLDGQPNTALHLDGVRSFVSIPRSDTLDIGTNRVSLSLWANLAAKPSQIGESFGGIYDSTSDSYILYLDRSRAELRFKVTDADGDAARPGIPETNLLTGIWHHVVGVFDGGAGPVTGQARIYLDGRLMDVHTGGDATPRLGLGGDVRPGQTAAIGRDGAEARYWLSCDVDDVAVWRRALRYGEILQIFSAGTAGASLQSQTAQITITDLSAVGEGQDLGLRCCVAHGIVAADELRLLRADSVHGPYAEEPGVAVQQMGNGCFDFLWPGASSAQGFFRIGHP